MGYVPAWVVSVFTGLAFVLVLIPLPWHYRARSTGTCLYIFWAALLNFNIFVNSIIWRNDAINRAPIWCDISAHIMVAGNVAIPASALCITRKLYLLSSVKICTVGFTQKLSTFIDLAIGLGIPLIQEGLYYIVQGHRFDIFERIGCFSESWVTPLQLVLIYGPPILVGLVSAVYGALAIRMFAKHRARFNEFLSSNGTNAEHYSRLMALCLVDICLTVPLATLLLCVTARHVNPWSWESTHTHFSRVGQYPYILWSQWGPWTMFDFAIVQWAPVLCGFIFFTFFGFTSEAMKNYRLTYHAVVGWIGLLRCPCVSSRVRSIGEKPKWMVWSSDTHPTVGSQTVVIGHASSGTEHSADQEKTLVTNHGTSKDTTISMVFYGDVAKSDDDIEGMSLSSLSMPSFR